MAVILLGASNAFAEGPAPALPPDDGALERLLWFDAILDDPPDGATEETFAIERARRMHQLEKLHESRRVEQPGFLAAQLVHYGVRSENELAWAVLAFAIHDTELTPGDLVAGAAPFLLSEDRREQGLADHLLKIAATRDGSPPDLTAFAHFIDGNPALVRWMYKFAPGPAMIAIGKSAWRDAPDGELRSLLYAEHVIADTIWKQGYRFLGEMEVEREAAEQLVLVATSESWYARLYAAEIMRCHRGFRDDSLIERLVDDEHSLVREAAARIRARE